MGKNMLEHNIFIVWNSEYNLGIPIIDEQHRGIVSTINSLHFGMQNNYGKNILSPIIEMMYDYTRIHFQIEESFLEKIDFPNAKRHHELHRDLSSKLVATGNSSLLDKDPYQFMDFLKGWWINHICNEDLIYKNYILSSAKK
jgi:hemerythrin